MDYSEDLVRLALQRIVEKYDIDDATALDADSLKVTCDDRGFYFCATTTKPVAINHSRSVAIFVSAGHSFSASVAPDDPTYEVYQAVAKGVESDTTAEGLPEHRKQAAIVPKSYDGVAHLLLVRFAEQKKVTIDELDASSLVVVKLKDTSMMLDKDDYMRRHHPDYYKLERENNRFSHHHYHSDDPRVYEKNEEKLLSYYSDYSDYQRNFTPVPTLKVTVGTKNGTSLEMSIPNADPDFNTFSKLVHSVGFRDFKEFVNPRNATKPMRLRDLFRKPGSGRQEEARRSELRPCRLAVVTLLHGQS